MGSQHEIILGGSHVLQHGHAVLLIKSSLNRIFAIVYYL